MEIIFGDVVTGVHGDDFEYLFSWQAGGPVSFKVDGREWLYRAPRPAVWRATTDNDRGNGFPIKSAMWLGADMFAACSKTELSVDGETVAKPLSPDNNAYGGPVQAETMTMTYTYTLPVVPATTVTVAYTVTPDGAIGVTVHYEGKEGLPELPAFGLRFIMPTPAKGFTYDGLSGETYPDRMAGGEPGEYTVEGMPVTPYLVPQDCGMHMRTKRVMVTRDAVLDNSRRDERDEFSLTFAQAEGAEPFAFSCLPYTPEEIENATHHNELPPVRRTVLTVCGAVRGVGGIDSWGSDVRPDFHIDAQQDHEFTFVIKP
ncbi:beta-galactosidase small subunit [Bifidobacterium merycicum]|uniref:beta-galactosidase small subunit n=1 Tax=Bifidobacterium merycicum TaxID=78345 RepID=UPI0015692748|nr:beta-galactosidase small subunit [Bifidobacterium merycicum]